MSGVRPRTCLEETVRRGPASLGRRWHRCSASREAARPPLGFRCPITAGRPQWLPGVVRHLAGPHEIPERRQRLLRVHARGGEEVGPELRRACERGADRVVHFALGTRCAARGSSTRVIPEVRLHDRGRRRSRRSPPSRTAGRAARVGNRAHAGAAAPTPTARRAARAPAAVPTPHASWSGDRRRARSEEARERRLLGRLYFLPQRRQ